ncbi:MAG: glycosyltransferase family 29 protein [Planctomycetota bacterium]
MKLIDPYEFRDMFRSIRSLAIVGNAPTVLEHDNGSFIDGHDAVVRFNRIRTEGIESKIGGRTDILCVNAANSLALAPSPAENCRPRCMICFVSPQGVRNGDAQPFYEWVGDIPTLLTFGPDFIGIQSSFHTRPLTSGTYVLFSLLRLFELDRLFITGFTMFGAVAGGTGKVYKDDRSGIGTFHDIDQEASIFARTLAEFSGELTATPEIFDLAQRAGVSLKGQNVRSANHATRRVGWKKRLADGIAWRVLEGALVIRRWAESVG